METMKTELSPAAQFVLAACDDAVNELSLSAPPESFSICLIAAALRAAADHLNAESPWPGHIESTGVNWSRNELHKIATELDAQP